MIKNNFQLILKGIGIALLIIIIATIFFYIFNFHNSKLSDDPTSWGVFGDYIGGVLNPIIALASLGVLGYLTYLVSIQTNEQSKSLFLLEKKMNAYEDLTKHIREINMIGMNLSKSIFFRKIYSELPKEQAIQSFLQDMKELRDTGSVYTEFYFTLFSFKLRYSQLFNYNFDSTEYQNLISETKAIGYKFQTIMKRVSERDHTVDSENFDVPDHYFDLLAKVINGIRSEIEINK